MVQEPANEADGYSHLSLYPKPCIFKDGEGNLHFPNGGRSTMRCDEKSMIIQNLSSPKGGACARSNHPAGSDRSLNGSVQKRSFAGTAMSCFRTTKSGVKSYFDKSRKTEVSTNMALAQARATRMASGTYMTQMAPMEQIWLRSHEAFLSTVYSTS
jgi:hypothetical protein